MAQDTIFSKIVAGEIPCNKVYEDDLVLAFEDINPSAKVHVLVIPKSNHLERLSEVVEDDANLMGHMMVCINKIAKDLGIDKTGYRVITNSGENAHQEVHHLHFHILGGESLSKRNN